MSWKDVAKTAAIVFAGLFGITAGASLIGASAFGTGYMMGQEDERAQNNKTNIVKNGEKEE